MKWSSARLRMKFKRIWKTVIWSPLLLHLSNKKQNLKSSRPKKYRNLLVYIVIKLYQYYRCKKGWRLYGTFSMIRCNICSIKIKCKPRLVNPQNCWTYKHSYGQIIFVKDQNTKKTNDTKENKSKKKTRQNNKLTLTTPGIMSVPSTRTQVYIPPF